MASRIKGITIEIGGDTTKLDRALRETDGQLSKVQKDLKDVERLLKLDPTNVELLAQKQRLLAEKSELAAQRLKTMENAANNLDDTLSKSKLDDFNLELDLTRAKAEQAAKELSDFDPALDKVNRAADDAADSLDDVGDSAKDLDDGFSVAKGAVADFVGNALTELVDVAVDAAKALWNMDEATEEYRKSMGMLQTAYENAGFSQETANEAYREFYKILGDTGQATEASQLLASLAESEEDISKWTEIAAGVFGTFGESLPIEGLIEAANETANVGQVTGVLADALNWAGISEDEFNEKLERCSTTSQRNRLIMDTLSGTYDEASDAFYRNNEALIQARENQVLLDDATAKLGETISNVKNGLLSEFLPGISEAITAFNDVLNNVDGADEALSDAIGEIISKLSEKLPDFLNFGVQILQSILQGIIDNLPVIFDGLVDVAEEIVRALLEMAPSLLEAGGEILTYIADGIEKGLPAFAEALPQIVESIVEYIEEELPAILDTGVEIIESLVNGILEAIPKLAESLPEVISTIVDFITNNIPKIVESGYEIIGALIGGLIKGIPDIDAAIPEIIAAILEGFAQLPEMLFDLAANAIQGLINGLLSAFGLGESEPTTYYTPNSPAMRAVSGAGQEITDFYEGTPALATGAIIPPNNPFLAVLGDNKRETEIVAPYSTIKQATSEAIAERGGGGTTTIIVKAADGFTRHLSYSLSEEDTRRGVRLVNRG